MRAWILLALSVTLSCGGKEEVGGTPVGSCMLGVSQLGANAEQWSCTPRPRMVHRSAVTPRSAPS
jgi:hypothetical protein